MFAHMRAAVFLAGIVAASACASPALAQHSGPRNGNQPTVSEILKHPVDDQDVRLRGHLLRQDTNDRYVFSDGTGQIFVQIDIMRLPGLSFDASTDVELTGQVNTRSDEAPEIEVKSAKVAD